jgi:hypothetical protein
VKIISGELHRPIGLLANTTAYRRLKKKIISGEFNRIKFAAILFPACTSSNVSLCLKLYLQLLACCIRNLLRTATNYIYTERYFSLSYFHIFTTPPATHTHTHTHIFANSMNFYSRSIINIPAYTRNEIPYLEAISTRWLYVYCLTCSIHSGSHVTLRLF